MTPSLTPHSLRTVDNFGSNAADADQLLKTCFERHPVYDGVVQGKSYLVLGRKGAGKTAIFQKLTDEADGVTAVAAAMGFNHYPWHYHKKQADVDVSTQLRYLASWRYLILLKLASQIVQTYERAPWSDSDEVFDATGALQAFLVDTYGSINPTFNTLFSPARKVKLSGSLGSKSFAQLVIDTVEMDKLPIHFTEINAAIEEAVMIAADPGVKYYVCFDELDLTFSANDVEYGQQIASLLHAARHIFHEGHRSGRSIFPIVFLREDIMAAYDFEEKGKIEDEALYLNWDDESAPVTLKTLMERRFREVLGSDSNPDVEWGGVFDEDELTRGRKPKYSYLLDRTLLRPRDVIKFCNEALREFKRDPNAGDLIGNVHLYAAKKSYSKYLFTEFRDEIHKHVPNYQIGIDVLKRIGLETFSPAEFLDIAETKDSMGREAALNLLSELFNYSLVGLQRVGGAGAGSSWSWKYRDADAHFDEHAPRCRVHPGLKEALQLTEAQAAR